MRVRIAHTAAVLALGTGLAFGASQRGGATATIDGKKVTVDYGRPLLKGRPLADLLKQLPEERIWRAGDDQVTTFTTEADLVIGGKRVPAGKYSVYVHLPADGARNLVLNKDLGIPLIKIWAQAPPNLANEPWPRLDGYEKSVADKEVLRAAMQKEAVTTPVDTFTIEMAPAKDGATMKLSWGEESWSIALQAPK
ncbi:MAG: DUF2911 domain-containing protein [Acidobacteria bacterium]|nr:DUF2911 domain-containing protein [Acidobacteriota bacterium]